MSGSRRERLAACRLYLIWTVRGAPVTERMWDTVEAVLDTGCVDALQLRDRSDDVVSLLARGERIRAMTRARDVLFLLNDQPVYVEALDADGAHVGQDDASPLAARGLIGPDRLLGLSTHDAAEIHAASAAPVDYLGLGPCFGTSSKHLTRPPGGPQLVAEGVVAAGTRPVFPIGGITTENAGALITAGARRLAVGSGILEVADPAAAARRLASMLSPAGE